MYDDPYLPPRGQGQAGKGGVPTWAWILIGVVFLALLGVGILLLVRGGDSGNTTSAPPSSDAGSGSGSDAGSGSSGSDVNTNAMLVESGGSGAGTYDFRAGLGPWKVEESWWENSRGLQEYTSSNVTTDASLGLVITAKKGQSPHGRSWTSGKVVSNSGMSSGKFSIRIIPSAGARAGTLVMFMPKGSETSSGALKPPEPACETSCGAVLLLITSRFVRAAIMTLRDTKTAFGIVNTNLRNAVTFNVEVMKAGVLNNGFATMPLTGKGIQDIALEWTTTRMRLIANGVAADKSLDFATQCKRADVECPFDKGILYVPSISLIVTSDFDPASPEETRVIIDKVSIEPGLNSTVVHTSRRARRVVRGRGRSASRSRRARSGSRAGRKRTKSSVSRSRRASSGPGARRKPPRVRAAPPPRRV
jgi:hypothetical protein